VYRSDPGITPSPPGVQSGMTQSRFPTFLAAILTAGMAAAGCRSGILRSALEPPSPHEEYAASLRRAGLEAAALGRDWLTAADGAIARAFARTLPFRETGYLAAEKPEAVGYRFPLARGQRLVAEVAWSTSAPSRLFVDLFEVRGAAEAPRRVASAQVGATRLAYESERDGDYVLRIQGELLRGGRFTVDPRAEPVLAFPVKERDARSIAGLFGDARDGGARPHEGIDVFAPRGTPAVAAADGVVLSAGTNPLGGNVVWLRDARRGLTYYYAHLDQQTVGAGDRVAAGETVGLVGNTGNARGASPHLHFGVYTRGQGALDPRPFVAADRRAAAVLTADAAALGSWRRVAPRPLPLASAPDDKAPASSRLPRHAVLRVVAATGAWYRVELPGGETGYVSARGTEPSERPLRRVRRAAETHVKERPDAAAPVVETVPAGSELTVLGISGSYLWVRTPEHRTGWLDETGTP